VRLEEDDCELTAVLALVWAIVLVVCLGDVATDAGEGAEEAPMDIGLICRTDDDPLDVVIIGAVEDGGAV
jgi:hypothetical protein